MEVPGDPLDQWLPIHLDDYFADRRSDPTPATVSTLRTQPGAMWPSDRGGAAVVRTFDRSFQRARERAGLPGTLTLHALRHSYATHLIEAGCDPMFVQQQVGHSTSSTTALYTSVSSDFKQKTIQRMIARRIARPHEESDV